MLTIIRFTCCLWSPPTCCLFPDWNRENNPRSWSCLWLALKTSIGVVTFSFNFLAILLLNYVINLLQFCKLLVSWDVRLWEGYLFFHIIGPITFETHDLKLLMSNLSECHWLVGLFIWWLNLVGYSSSLEGKKKAPQIKSFFSCMKMLFVDIYCQLRKSSQAWFFNRNLGKKNVYDAATVIH